MSELIQALNGKARLVLIVVGVVFAVGLSAGAALGGVAPWQILTEVRDAQAAIAAHAREIGHTGNIERINALRDSETKHHEQLRQEIQQLRTDVMAELRAMRQEMRQR